MIRAMRRDGGSTTILDLQVGENPLEEVTSKLESGRGIRVIQSSVIIFLVWGVAEWRKSKRQTCSM